MNRNLWNSEEQPTFPEPAKVEEQVVPEYTGPNADEIAAVKAKIAELESEESLTTTAEVLLKTLRASLAALGQEG